MEEVSANEAEPKLRAEIKDLYLVIEAQNMTFLRYIEEEEAYEKKLSNQQDDLKEKEEVIAGLKAEQEITETQLGDLQWSLAESQMNFSITASNLKAKEQELGVVKARDENNSR